MRVTVTLGADRRQKWNSATGRYRTFWRLVIATEKMEELPFDDTHYPFAQEDGLPEIAALRLVNKWNGTSRLFHYWVRP